MQAYSFPNMAVDIKLCRCNIAPKTIVRGPGFLNATLIAEHILEHVAQRLALDPVLVRERNFLTSLTSHTGPSAPSQPIPSPSSSQAACGGQRPIADAMRKAALNPCDSFSTRHMRPQVETPDTDN